MKDSRTAAPPRFVDEDIHVAAPIERKADQLPRRIGFSQIHRDRMERGILAQGSKRIRRYVPADDPGPFRQKHFRAGAPNARSGSRNDDRLAPQLQVQGSPQ